MAKSRDEKLLVNRKINTSRVTGFTSSPETVIAATFIPYLTARIKSRKEKLYSRKRGWKSLNRYFTQSLLKNSFISSQDTLGITLKIFIFEFSPTLYTGLISTSRMVQKAIFS